MYMAVPISDDQPGDISSPSFASSPVGTPETCCHKSHPFPSYGAIVCFPHAGKQIASWGAQTSCVDDVGIGNYTCVSKTNRFARHLPMMSRRIQSVWVVSEHHLHRLQIIVHHSSPSINDIRNLRDHGTSTVLSAESCEQARRLVGVARGSLGTAQAFRDNRG